MTRKKKYQLDRTLIELENIVQELTNYCEIRRIFDDMFDSPINQLQELMPTELKKEDMKWN